VTYPHPTPYPGGTTALLDGRQVAGIYKCSVRTVERMVERGVLPQVQIGRLRRYRLADVQRLMDPNPTNAERSAVTPSAQAENAGTAAHDAA
jgi:excisionase family DNA binding protein